MRKLFALLASLVLLSTVTSAAAAEPAFPDFIPFDRNADEYPEGVAVDKVGNVYVSIDDLGQVWKFTPDGEQSVLADFEGIGALGLAVDAVGDVYLARGFPFQGVWRIHPDGSSELVPGTDAIAIPNALAFDKRGNLYVSETFSLDDPVPYECPGTGGTGGIAGSYGEGGVWVVPKGGQAELWLRDELLTGLCLFPIPFPVGANGISYRHGDIFVNNTEKALVVRIPVENGGVAGTPEVLAQVTGFDPQFGPPGLDGMALDVHGNIYVPVITQSRFV